MERELRLDGATFQWSPNEPLLQGTNLALHPGRITGLSGANGSGKSTLIHLLTRRYPLAKGMLTVDGVAAEEIDLHDYRRNVALIPETVKIFNGTLGANLAMAAPDPFARSPTGAPLRIVRRNVSGPIQSRPRHGDR